MKTFQRFPPDKQIHYKVVYQVYTIYQTIEDILKYQKVGFDAPKRWQQENIGFRKNILNG